MEQIINSNNPVNLIQDGVVESAKIGMAPVKKFPKYMLYSGHDTNIGNLWAYLQPIDFKQDNLAGKFVDWYTIPFASSI